MGNRSPERDGYKAFVPDCSWEEFCNYKWEIDRDNFKKGWDRAAAEWDEEQERSFEEQERRRLNPTLEEKVEDLEEKVELLTEEIQTLKRILDNHGIYE